MTDTEDEDLDVEFISAEPIVLHEDSVWIPDPDALHHDSGEQEGVLAVMLRAGCVWYLDGVTRQWFNAEKDGAKKARPLRPVN